MPEIDWHKLRRYSLREYESLVEKDLFAALPEPGASAREFLDSLPRLLAAGDFRRLVDAIVDAKRNGRRVVVGAGAHLVKVGASPVIIDLISRGIIDHFAANGALAIHDFEIALTGRTSEDVLSELDRGRFGMARETPEAFAAALDEYDAGEQGLGAVLGRLILDRKLEAGPSILGTAARVGRPVTLHIALGTDVVHMHPELDAATLGMAAMRDFRRFCDQVAELADGVYINVGSAVVMPEVFLKAVAVCRNQGIDLNGLTTADFDMIRHYRPTVNVVRRPPSVGLQLTGHHEIMLPLLRMAVLEQLED